MLDDLYKKKLRSSSCRDSNLNGAELAQKWGASPTQWGFLRCLLDLREHISKLLVQKTETVASELSGTETFPFASSRHSEDNPVSAFGEQTKTIIINLNK